MNSSTTGSTVGGFFLSGGERSGIDLGAEFCEHRVVRCSVWSFAKAAIAWAAML